MNEVRAKAVMNEVKDCFGRKGQPGEAGPMTGVAGPTKGFSK